MEDDAGYRRIVNSRGSTRDHYYRSWIYTPEPFPMKTCGHCNRGETLPRPVVMLMPPISYFLCNDGTWWIEGWIIPACETDKIKEDFGDAETLLLT